jgi:hypothetical protein
MDHELANSSFAKVLVEADATTAPAVKAITTNARIKRARRPVVLLVIDLRM